MNSGIGPKEELQKVNVPVVHNLPGVGKNFHDHIQYVLPLTINEKDVSAYDWASVSEYLLNRKGPLSSTGEVKILEVRSYDSETILNTILIQKKMI